ncbi:hypothetical protein CRG98_043489 [Punica granatum]|uniref:Uncharacterized protein n=1 Tax=Punica granatum TaxID=22663 RepID=A0A2I0HX61_PUNGR|nr:hypothetical protein CRG98_043489 [Punica granatum]
MPGVQSEEQVLHGCDILCQSSRLTCKQCNAPFLFSLEVSTVSVFSAVAHRVSLDARPLPWLNEVLRQPCAPRLMTGSSYIKEPVLTSQRDWAEGHHAPTHQLSLHFSNIGGPLITPIHLKGSRPLAPVIRGHT